MTDKMQSLALAPVGNLDSYIRAANAWPMLSADEERALAEKLHYHGDLEAAKTLILSHLRFVVHIARNYAGYGLPQADLIQEGNIGLMKAVRRFNPEVGVRLVSFAVHWIKAEIHEYVLRNWRIVKVATTKAQRKLFFNLRKTKQRLGWFNQDEVEMVARELGVTSKDVREMESRMAAQDMTFDLSSDDDSDSQPMAPVLYLQDKSSNFADGIEDDNWEEQAANRLTDAMQGLDERSQDIIRARWLDEDNKSTLQELAGLLVMLLPWSAYQAGQSPFVTFFSKLGVPYIGSIMNIVVLTAALSSLNSGLYCTGRILRSMAMGGSAPSFMAKMSRQHVPYAGILATLVVYVVGVFLNYLVPSRVFEIVLNFASLGIIASWAFIIVCQMRLRKAIKQGKAADVSFKLPGAPFTSWLTLLFLLSVLVLMAFDYPNGTYTIAALPIIGILLVIGWFGVRKRVAEIHSTAPVVEEDEEKQEIVFKPETAS